MAELVVTVNGDPEWVASNHQAILKTVEQAIRDAGVQPDAMTDYVSYEVSGIELPEPVVTAAEDEEDEESEDEEDEEEEEEEE